MTDFFAGAKMNLAPTEQALVRGWLQGLSWERLGATYLGHGNIKEVRKTIAALLDRLRLKAQRSQREDLLLPSRLPRSMRDMSAAMATFNVLLALPEPKPRLSDGTDLWFSKVTSKKLSKNGLTTLAPIVEKMMIDPNELRLGKEAFRQVQFFLEENRVALGYEPAMTLALRQNSFRPPEYLNGTAGSNRATGPCQIEASDDLSAIRAWLGRWPDSSSTYRAYQKEAERLLLWAIKTRQKAMSSLTVEDCVEYKAFLLDPQPANQWIGPPSQKWSKEWRPFQGPLSPRSAQQALTILNGLFEWLTKCRYLEANPFSLIKRRSMPYPIQVHKAFTETEMTWLLQYCQEHNLPQRYTLILRLGHETGLRISEMVNARRSDLQMAGAGQWWLSVIGKGGKTRRLPITNEMAEALKGQGDDQGPLIKKGRGSGHISPSGLHKALKRFFEKAAIVAEQTDKAIAQRIRSASTHWLRHTHASHALQRGAPINAVRENLGHSNLQTTSIYLHTEEDLRHLAITEIFAPAKTR